MDPGAQETPGCAPFMWKSNDVVQECKTKEKLHNLKNAMLQRVQLVLLSIRRSQFHIASHPRCFICFVIKGRAQAGSQREHPMGSTSDEACLH